MRATASACGVGVDGPKAPRYFDWSKFGQSFGPYTPTPHAEAVARTVAWFREN